MSSVQSAEVQMKSKSTMPMPENYAKILYHCKLITILDLALKFAIIFWFPMLETLIFGLVSSIPSAIAFYGICIEKEPINKSKWLLPAIIHHALVYISFLGYVFIYYLYFLLSGQSKYAYEKNLPLDPIRQLLLIVMLSGTGLGVAIFAFVQMGRMFLFKWSDLIMVANEENDKSKEEQEQMMV